MADRATSNSGGGVSGQEHAALVSFVDRVIVPALVEKFLRDHSVQFPERGGLAKTKPAA